MSGCGYTAEAMSKRRRGRERGQRTPHRAPARQPAAARASHPPTTEPSRIRLWAGRGAAWLGIAATVLGLAATVLSYFPKFSVAPEAPLNPDDPISSPFVVSYDGIVPLRNVRLHCIVDSLGIGTSLIAELTVDPDTRVVQPWMWPGDATATYCYGDDWGTYFRPGSRVTRGTVNIHIMYSPALFPVSLERVVRFRGVVQTDSSLRWVRAASRSRPQ
jgi:hypothetical protein